MNMPKKKEYEAEMYGIEKLVQTFLYHGRRSEIENKRIIAEFLENYPDEPLPDHFKEKFNIAFALASICSQLLKLKREEKC